jgi:hypothetical protein
MVRLNKAQSLTEYAILATLVIAAIAGMQVYLKRGLQARVKTFVDGATNGTSFLARLSKPLSQYEPYYVQSDITSQALQELTTTHIPGGSTKYVSGNTVTRKGTITTKGTSDEDLKQDDAWED